MSEDKQPKSPEPKVSSKKPAEKESSQAIRIFLAILILVGFGAYLYIQNQPEPVEEPEPEPEPVVIEPEPEPEPIVMEPEPEPEPVIPDPIEIHFAQLTEKSELWPQTLELTDGFKLEIVYNGEIFGEMTFTKGQSIQVTSLEASGNVVGKIGGQLLSVPVTKTDLAPWFGQTHAESYILVDLSPSEEHLALKESELSDDEFIEELEEWCLLNFGDCSLEIGSDKLTLTWKKQAGLVNYAEEATFLAHHYLKLQAKRSQGDNYARCEIIDRNTGKVLGFGVSFMPTGTLVN